MRFRLLGVAALAVLAAAALAQAAMAPRVTYTRSFKGSDPAFFQIEISQSGQATYQAREKDADPVTTLAFTASPATASEVFRAAAALHDFSAPALQSKDKVAYTGDKLLAFDDATHHASQIFTYTKVPAAARLAALFEKISTTGMDAIRLRRAMQYSRLDVLGLMEQIQQDWDGGQMAEPQLLAPTLQQLAADANQMQAARKRAQALLDAIAPRP